MANRVRSLKDTRQGHAPGTGVPGYGELMKSTTMRLVFGTLFYANCLTFACGQAEVERRNDFLHPRPFLQIPGPNPILTPGEPGTWDSNVVETGDAFKDFGTYYLYYHATGPAGGYQTGVATSSHPLGPFTKLGDEPVLPLGPKGSWDAGHTACAMVLKEGTDRYLMWYSGMGDSAEHEKWGVGLATASAPEGPWTKHPQNPLLEHFGYVGGVVKVNGEYRLYTAHPIGSTAPDFSPISLATADTPEGPWEIHAGNPVMRQGEWSEWDSGGYSEGEVLFHGGLFHMFYGGSKTYDPRILTRESIGYAYSRNGVQWTKYGGNPVATREAEPNAAAYAEVHAIIEPPFIYLYHTLRYKNSWRERFRDAFPVVEDLGMQILVMQRPFRLDMPLLHKEALAAGTTTSLRRDKSPIIALNHVTSASITVQCTYATRSTFGIRLHVRSSADGADFDTEDLFTWEPRFRPKESVQQTFSFQPTVKFIKVLVENLDTRENVTDLKLTATLGG